MDKQAMLDQAYENGFKSELEKIAADTYYCPKCDYTSDKPGMCPKCDIPLKKGKPGMKLRSGGAGRGMGTGKGRGPIGIPVGKK